MRKAFTLVVLFCFVVFSYLPVFAISTESISNWQDNNKEDVVEFIQYSISEQAYKDFINHNLNFLSPVIEPKDEDLLASAILSNIGIGVSDKERHAGVNFVTQIHGKDIGGKMMPKPCALDMGNNYIKAVPTKCFLVIKPFILNEGKIKEQNANVAEMVLEYDEATGGYVVNTDSLGVGSYGVQLSCTHRGGMTIYQILIFRIKLPYDIKDENGFVLNIVDPQQKFSAQEEWIVRYTSGYLRSDGLDINPKPMPYPEYQDPNCTAAELPNVIVEAYSDQNMNCPGIARVQVSYGPNLSQHSVVKMTEGGKVEFVVPPGPIKIRATSSEGKLIAVGNVPSEVRRGEKIELKTYIQKGGVR